MHANPLDPTLVFATMLTSFTNFTAQEELEAWLRSCPLDSKQIHYSVAKAGNGNLRVEIGAAWEFVRASPASSVGSGGPPPMAWNPPGMIPTNPFSASALPGAREQARRPTRRAAHTPRGGPEMSPRLAGIASVDSDGGDSDEDGCAWSVKAESGNSHEQIGPSRG